MTLTKANLLSKESLTPHVFKIVLKPEEPINFKAGQYLQVVMADEDKRPFSIANTPATSDLIELHIGATPDNPYAYEVLQRLEQQQWLMLEVGLGNAHVKNTQLEAVLIAGGTGYSYTKSVLFNILETQPERKVTLYWGAKSFADLYEAAELQALSNKHAHFKFIPVVELPDSDWTGKVGFVHQVVMQDFTNFSAIEVYVAGRFDMAKAVKADLLPLGLKAENLIGDAFAFI
ncbi:NAD(P)H-flavin reductase [Glaciecola siphonariae]|uniref:NAD(P)H-flavin reductase n=1 Tax=Glaciecola siphonariae TaxID=521012 RepID=A0ABV9LY45_9ALTE